MLNATSPALRTERSVGLALQQFCRRPVMLLASSSVGDHNDGHAAALREWLRCRGHGFVRLWAAWRSHDSATVRQQWLVMQGLSEHGSGRLVGLTRTVAKKRTLRNEDNHDFETIEKHNSRPRSRPIVGHASQCFQVAARVFRSLTCVFRSLAVLPQRPR